METQYEFPSPQFKRIAEFAAYDDGWDGDDAKAITRWAIARAFYAVDLIRRATNGIEPIHSIPMDEGGLLITWEVQASELDMMIGGDGAISYCDFDGNDHKAPIRLQDAVLQIIALINQRKDADQ